MSHNVHIVMDLNEAEGCFSIEAHGNQLGNIGHLTNRVDLIDLPNCEQKFTNVEV